MIFNWNCLFFQAVYLKMNSSLETSSSPAHVGSTDMNYTMSPIHVSTTDVNCTGNPAYENITDITCITNLVLDNITDLNYTSFPAYNDSFTNDNYTGYSIFPFLNWEMLNTGLQCSSFDCVYAERHREQYHDALVMLTVILSTFATVGAIGNIISLIVFSRTKIKSTSIYFILLLSITDLFVCVFVIPGFIIREWRFKFYFDVICKSWELLRSASIPISSMIMVAIAIDRFFIVFLNSKVKITKLKSRIIVGVIMISGLCLGIPSSLAVGVNYRQSQGQLANGKYCMSNFINISYDLLMKFWYFVTFMFLVMILLIIILYGLIFITAYKQDRKWSKFRSTKVNPIRVIPRTKPDTTTGNETSMSIFTRTRTCGDNSSELANDKCFHKVIQLKQINKQLDQTCPWLKGTSSNEMNVQLNPTNREPLADDIGKFNRSIISIEEYSNMSTGECQDGKSTTDMLNIVLPNQVEDTPEDKKKGQGQAENLSMKATNNIITGMIPAADDKSYQHNDTNFIQDNRQPFQRSSFGRIDSQCYIARNIPGISRQLPETQIMSDHHSENITDTSQQENQTSSHFEAETRSNTDESQGHSKSMKRKSIHWKTTQILFTVTIVYIASFLPIFLMSYNLIPQNKILYYMYFLNNVANPIIYSFMNKNFRDDVKKVFCKTQNA